MLSLFWHIAWPPAAALAVCFLIVLWNEKAHQRKERRRDAMAARLLDWQQARTSQRERP